jgi:oligoendopeptidase F
MEKKQLEVIHDSWNLSALFKNDDDKNILNERAEIEKNSYLFINKWKDRTDYLNDPFILREALDEYESLERKYGDCGKEGMYFMLRSAQEQDNPNLKAKISKLNEFWQKIENDIQFFEHKIAKIHIHDQAKFLNHQRLTEYKHFLERSFENAKYLLTEEEEKILNLKSQTSYANWVRMTTSFISKEERMMLRTEKMSTKTSLR